MKKSERHGQALSFFNLPAYILAYLKTVFRKFRIPEQHGLAKPLGEASSANIAFS